MDNIISPNFSRREFACRCGCGFDTVDVELLAVLEDVRRQFSAPVIINSGCRCESHNRLVKGARNSQHVKAKAADIKIHGVQPELIFAYLSKKYVGKYGIGCYPTFTHVDVRANPARWQQ